MWVDHIWFGNSIKLNRYLAIHTCQFSYVWSIFDRFSRICNGDGTRVF